MRNPNRNPKFAVSAGIDDFAEPSARSGRVYASDDIVAA